MRAHIDRILAAIAAAARKANTAIDLVIVSSLAEGSDRIVAEAGLAAGFALQVALPFNRAEYVLDFETQTSRTELNNCSTAPAMYSSLAVQPISAPAPTRRQASSCWRI